MLYALLAALVLALASAGYGLYENKSKEAAEARAEAQAKDAIAARAERDRAYRVVKEAEEEVAKERGRAAVLDQLLVEKNAREKLLEKSKLAIKSEYDALKSKLDKADTECLARDLPDSIRVRLSP